MGRLKSICLNSPTPQGPSPRATFSPQRLSLTMLLQTLGLTLTFAPFLHAPSPGPQAQSWDKSVHLTPTQGLTEAKKKRPLSF